MIRNVVKYLIVGSREDLDEFFDQAQERGFLEFISATPKKPLDAPELIQNLLRSIKILKKQPVREQYEGGGDVSLAMQQAELVIELKENIDKLSEEKRSLEIEKVRVGPFGDFSLDDLDFIEKEGHRKMQFFCMKTSRRQKVVFPDELLYIGTEYDLDYFISISPKPIAPHGMIEMHIDAPLGEVESRLDFVEDALTRFEHELKDQAAYLDFLHHILVEELNAYHLHSAKKEALYPLENAAFFIEAWIPENKVATLHGLIDGMSIYAEQIAIDETDKVPTCLDNHGAGKLGEDLIKIYDIPAITDKDPSLWVLCFFAIFFAVIIGDGGYGALFLLLALYLKKKFPRLQGAQKRLLSIFMVLSCACIGWGILTASFFGLKLAPDNMFSKMAPMTMLVEKKADFHLAKHDDVYESWLQKYPSIASATSGKEMLQMVTVKKKTATTYPMIEEFTGNILLEFALILGIIHLSLSLLRNLRRHIAGLGWVFFMIGGYLFFPTILNATTIPEFLGLISKPVSGPLGLQLLYGGIGFALIVSVLQHRLKGLAEIANLVQVFSDVLSYLRLYALGLAGAIMASTFNQEGSALGLFAGFIVILAGHGINMLLSLMGGVIHGLRLNFLEWYHFCFTGGGKLFNPLHKLKREFWRKSP